MTLYDLRTTPNAPCRIAPDRTGRERCFVYQAFTLPWNAGRDRVVQTVVSANAFSIWTYLSVSKLALQTHVR